MNLDEQQYHDDHAGADGEVAVDRSASNPTFRVRAIHIQKHHPIAELAPEPEIYERSVHTPAGAIRENAAQHGADTDTDAQGADHNSLKKGHFALSRRTTYPLMAKAPCRSPAAPKPSNARPNIETEEPGAAAQIMDPT